MAIVISHLRIVEDTSIDYLMNFYSQFDLLSDTYCEMITIINCFHRFNLFLNNLEDNKNSKKEKSEYEALFNLRVISSGTSTINRYENYFTKITRAISVSDFDESLKNKEITKTTQKIGFGWGADTIATLTDNLSKNFLNLSQGENEAKNKDTKNDDKNSNEKKTKVDENLR